MKRNLIFIGLALLLLGCDQGPKTPAGCEDMSLRHDCLEVSAKALPAPVYSEKSPGESTLMPRSFATAPPQIPHSIEGLPVTAEANMCLGCHFPGGDGIPAVPPSHLERPKIAMGQVSNSPQTTRVVGTEKLEGDFHQGRYFCNQCHVPQAGNLKPLVLNRF